MYPSSCVYLYVCKTMMERWKVVRRCGRRVCLKLLRVAIYIAYGGARARRRDDDPGAKMDLPLFSVLRVRGTLEARRGTSDKILESKRHIALHFRPGGGREGAAQAQKAGVFWQRRWRWLSRHRAPDSIVIAHARREPWRAQTFPRTFGGHRSPATAQCVVGSATHGAQR